MRVYHADHGVIEALIAALVATVSKPGFFAFTADLPADAPSLRNALYGPASGDAPVHERDVHYKRRTMDRPPSRMIGFESRPTRQVTIIGNLGPSGVDDPETAVFTCYGGPLAEREPGDPSLEPGSPEHQAAVKFWAAHALASG